MFEIGGRYANRSGFYTVLSIDGPKMTVRYEDGSEATLRMNIQERIWANIEADLLAEAAKNERRLTSHSGHLMIKTVSTVSIDDLDMPAIKDKLAIVETKERQMNPGDRFIYFAIEQRIIFAVATVTGPSVPAKGAVLELAPPGTKVRIYPLDVDTYLKNLDQLVTLDAIELESQPDFRDKLMSPDLFLTVSEDEFELLAEMISEISEDDDEDVSVVEDDEDLEEEPDLDV